MRPDVLYWFYDEFALCQERLRRLRHREPGLRIYALFGGPVAQAGEARDAVAAWVDDFYAYPEDHDPKWKRRHGDQLLAAWYRDRGHGLAWNTVYVMQWDVALFAPLGQLFSDLNPGEALFSGFRPMSEVQDWWPWARMDDGELDAFRNWLPSRLRYRGPLYACLFIVACLPRGFLHHFVTAGDPVPGFLEYKLPTLAMAFGIPVCHRHPFHPWWAAEPTTRNASATQRVLNAVGQEVSTAAIDAELARGEGARLFHPRRQLHPRELGDPASWDPGIVPEA